MTTRQEIYDRIRSSSKDEVILEEMIRLGFWPRQQAMPQDPAEDIRRKGELERALRELTTENRRLQNIDVLKQEARKKRLAAARQRRRETKERRLRERAERAEAWKKRQQQEIIYLGQAVSTGLNHREEQTDKLNRNGLPSFKNEARLARDMGISVRELRFLAFSRTTSKVSHYVRFAIRKKLGGLRHISAPMPRLKRAQEWILRHILEKVALNRAAHGFRRGRSILTNAQPHVGAAVVVNIDLEDFFPTVTYKRIKGVYRNLGYSEHISTILALICSEPEIDEVSLDGQRYYVARGDRRLPQGAPTSPALTNIICRGLDARIRKAAEAYGFTYTRYADDITLSGKEACLDKVGKILGRVEYVVKDEGFRVHPDKTRILRRGRRQEVTGLVVNDRVGIPRKTLRQFRATLFQIDRDGPAGKKWGSSNDVIAAIEGYANFVHMVDPAKGAALKAQVAGIIEKYGRGAPATGTARERWTPRVQEDTSDSVSTIDDGDGSNTVGAGSEAPPRRPWWKRLFSWK